MQSAARDDFTAWLGSPIIRVSTTRQHGQWYACADAFGIAGTGSTKAAAYRKVGEMVEAYLRTYYIEGRTFDEATRARNRPRPKPWTATARQIGQLLERIPLPWSHARKSDMVLPSVLQH